LNLTARRRISPQCHNVGSLDPSLVEPQSCWRLRLIMNPPTYYGELGFQFLPSLNFPELAG
jgi:hypothetical protein